MEAAVSSETSVPIYQTARRRSLYDGNLKIYGCENLRSHLVKLLPGCNLKVREKCPCLLYFVGAVSWFNFVGKLKCQLFCAIASTPAVCWQVQKRNTCCM